jgi:hypothetical protein
MTRLFRNARQTLANLSLRRSLPPEEPAPRSDGDRDWIENYLIGSSDQDAIWYYERRRWRV